MKAEREIIVCNGKAQDFKILRELTVRDKDYGDKIPLEKIT